ncbi:MAG: hypothetical protein L7V86_04240 [Verrucomicrobiales bacterium]|jgi:hypothetical protein|nr:hypothetical protein [Verrucomicrobiales bacterium]
MPAQTLKLICTAPCLVGGEAVKRGAEISVNEDDARQHIGSNRWALANTPEAAKAIEVAKAENKPERKTAAK